jgi:hypothetical protein
VAGGVETLRKHRGLRASASQRRGDTAAPRSRGGQRGGFDSLIAQESPASGTVHSARGKPNYHTC